MLLKDFLPNPSIRDFVKCFRIVHFEFDKDVELPVKAYPPKPEAVLRFLLRDRDLVEIDNDSKKRFRYQVVLSGQQTSVYKRYLPRNYLAFQIVFQPSALFRLTGIPSNEFTNLHEKAECYFSTKLHFAHEQLCEAGSYDEMLIVANKFVCDLVCHARKSSHLLDEVGKEMIKYGGNISIDWLAKKSCLCTKQFDRKFNERIGVNPKTYARIIRFNKAYNIKNRYPDMDWLRIAIECDYFDYQHLVKDYIGFTGITPNEFHVLESKSPERILGLSDEVYHTRINMT